MNMKLHEIALASLKRTGRESDINAGWQKQRQYAKHAGKIDNLDVFIYMKNGVFSSFLVNEKKSAIGQALFRYDDKNSLYKEYSVDIKRKYQGQGLGPKWYAFLIDKLEMTIQSDIVHSPGTRKMYIKLAGHPKIQAYGVLNLENDLEKPEYTLLEPNEVNDYLEGNFDIYHDEINDEKNLYLDEIDAIEKQIEKSNNNNEIKYLKTKFKQLKKEYQKLLKYNPGKIHIILTSKTKNNK